MGTTSLSQRLRNRVAMVPACSLTDQEPVGFQCCHAAESGGGDRLAEHVVGHVSGGKDSGHAGGRRAWNDLDVASRPHRKLTGEQGCRRCMTYCDEDAIDLQGKMLPGQA